MDVYEIQTVALECLRAAKVPKVLRTTIYSLSGSPEKEAGVTARRGRNIVVVEFVASFDEFMSFRDCANSRGVWITASFEPFGALTTSPTPSEPSRSTK
jgi:hypothetical protein